METWANFWRKNNHGREKEGPLWWLANLLNERSAGRKSRVGNVFISAETQVHCSPFKDLFIHAGSQNRTTAVVGRLSRIQLCTSSGRLDNNRRCQLDASLRKESDWNIRRRITALEASPPTAFHLLHADKTRSSLCKRRRREKKWE